MKPNDAEIKGNVNATTENAELQISDDMLDEVSGGATFVEIENPFDHGRNHHHGLK